MLGTFWLIDRGLNLLSLLTGAMAATQFDLTSQASTPAPDTPFMREVQEELAFPETQLYADAEVPALGAANTGNDVFGDDSGAATTGNGVSVTPGDSPPSGLYGSEHDPADTPASDNGNSSDIGSTSSRARPKKIQVSSADCMGIGFDELEASSVICLKCKYPIHEQYRARSWGKKNGQLQWICRVCNNVYSMVKKKLDMESLEEAGLELDFIKGDTAEAFYKHAHDVLGDTVKWQDLKELICQDLSRRKISRDTLLVSQEQLPLPVWATRGFDVEAIQRGGRKFAHPDFGEVWSTPLKTVNTETVTMA